MKCKKCIYYKKFNMCSFWNAGSNYGNYTKGLSDLSGCTYYKKK